MAAANEVANVSIAKKISLGNGTYLYIGTLTFGTEYATGGMTLATAANERYAVPEKIDWAGVGGIGGYDLTFTAPNKISAYRGPAALKGAGEQVPAAENLSATIKGAPVVIIGC